MEIINAIQSAKGVAHAMPETPMRSFRSSINTTSRLGFAFFPVQSIDHTADSDLIALPTETG